MNSILSEFEMKTNGGQMFLFSLGETCVLLSDIRWSFFVRVQADNISNKNKINL